MKIGSVGATAMLLVVSVFLGFEAAGQVSDTYVPRKVYTSGSGDLKSALKNQLTAELVRLGGKSYAYKLSSDVQLQYRTRTRELINLVNTEMFLQDDTLQAWVDTVMQTLVSRNDIPHKPVRVLIMKTPVVNAACFGEGTFMVTTGLLAGIRTEGELAFTLAHEVAHYSLDHIKKRTYYQAEKRVAQKTKRGVTRVLVADNITNEEIDTLRSLVYRASEYSRAQETEADSLGLLYVKRAGYHPQAGQAVLTLLDSADYTRDRLGVKVFEPLNLASYPFQEIWLNPRLAIYSKRRQDPIFSTDSVRSHPDLMSRVGALLRQDHTPAVAESPSPYVQSTITLARFAAVDAAISLGTMDLALLRALELKAAYPKHDYVTGAVSRIILQLLQWKDNDSFQAHVPSYTTGYGDELRMVNTFINNLTLEEIGELGFNFLNNRDNFNPRCREHYLLLWHLCDLTGRPNVAEKVKGNYVARFGKDDNTDKMKRGGLVEPVRLTWLDLLTMYYRTTTYTRFPHLVGSDL